MTNSKWDIVIIGGGPAGMSAALVAGRSLLKTVLINAEQPRNIVTTASHGFLTRDGAHPTELLAIAKVQLEKYSTVSYVKGTAIQVDNTRDGFVVVTSGNETYLSERLIIATGYKDDIAACNIVGLDDVYGKSVYPCPFCDGWEHRGQKLALFGGGEFIGEFAKTIHHWSADLIVFTNGDTSLGEEAKRELLQHGAVVEERKIIRLHSTEGQLSAVELSDGDLIERGAGFIFDTHEEPATRFATQLGVGLTTNDWGFEVLDTQESGETSVQGLYVVGDARTGFSGLISAARDGALCVESIVHSIVAEKWS